MPQAEAAGTAGRWQDAEAAYAEALTIDAQARLINTALWLGLCSARVHLRKAASAAHACSQAAEHAPDDPEPVVLKVGC